jgi:FkbM family methyltransferase
MRDYFKSKIAMFPALQYRQSFAKDFLDQRLDPFIGKKGGFFIEAGANDGISQSNTLYFEKYLGWKGILVEPVPELAALCRTRRPRSSVEEVALTSKQDAGTLEITIAGLMSTTTGAFSGNSEYSAVKHLERAALSSSPDSRSTKTIEVATKTLSQIIEDHGCPDIDLLSLDVEGYEEEALKGLDLNKGSGFFSVKMLKSIGAG